MDTDPTRPPHADAAEGRQLVHMFAVFYGICTLFAVGYALFSGAIQTLLGERAPALSHILGAIAVGLVIVGVTRVAFRAWQPMRTAARDFAEMLGPLGPREAIVLALLSGIGEELLFRGALWPHLGLPGTTCLFALVHIIPKRGLWWGYPLFALLAGLLLGLLRHGTGSVVPPIIAHVVVNAINLAWIGKNHVAWTRSIEGETPAGDAPVQDATAQRAASTSGPLVAEPDAPPASTSAPEPTVGD